jgi:hypothetical protein
VVLSQLARVCSSINLSQHCHGPFAGL